MNTNCKDNDWPIIKLHLAQLSHVPGKFCMSFGFDISLLANSIKKVGLINKPLITKDKKENIEIVTGYRRILALKELNVNEVLCFDLSDSGKTDLDMFMMNIYDNQNTRNFNNVEKSMALNRINDFIKKEKIDDNLISMLEINKRELEIFFKIETLPDSLKYAISDNSISIKALETLLRLDNDKDRMLCVEWINNLKLNYNQQLQFIEYITEISLLMNASIHQTLMDDALKKINEDEKKNTPQKAKALLNKLREKRFPDLTMYEKIFNQRVKKLQLPGNIKIRHPRYFESEGYQLEIDFKDGFDLKNNLDHLINVKGLESVGDPWEKDQ